MKHQLDLLGNSIDSFNEGLRRYEDAKDLDVRAYKFAVLHLAHALELLLKYAVSQQHPLLVYRKPAAPNLVDEPTIGLKEAIAILRNAGVSLDQQLIDDLVWLKRLRNQIEHYSFTVDIDEVRTVLGRIIRASSLIAAPAGVTNLAERLEADARFTFARLLEAYDERLAAASQAALAEAGGTSDIQNCGLCGEPTAVRRKKFVHCHFCGYDDPFVPCVICEQRLPHSEMFTWNDDDPTEITYICDICSDRINAE